MYTVPTLKLTLEGANKIIEAALEEAKAKGRKIGVAVVDVGGNLIAFARMDGASVTTISVAQNKARCRRIYRSSERQVEQGGERAERPPCPGDHHGRRDGQDGHPGRGDSDQGRRPAGRRRGHQRCRPQ